MKPIPEGYRPAKAGELIGPESLFFSDDTAGWISSVYAGKEITPLLVTSYCHPTDAITTTLHEDFGG